MSMRSFQRLLSMFFLTVFVGAGFPSLAAINIESITLTDKYRAGRHQFTYVFDVTVNNTSDNVNNLVVTAESAVGSTVINSTAMHLTHLGANESALLEGQLVITQDRRVPFNQSALSWSIDYEDDNAIANTFSPNAAYHTGEYTNFFSALGIASEEEVTAKLQATYAQLFELMPENDGGENQVTKILKSDSFDTNIANWVATPDNGSELSIALKHESQALVVSPSWQTTGDVFSVKNQQFMNVDFRDGVTISMDVKLPETYIIDGNLITQLILEDENFQPAFLGYTRVTGRPADTFFTLTFNNINPDTAFGYISDSFDFSSVRGLGLQFIAGSKPVDIVGDIVIDNVVVSTASVDASPEDNGKSLLFGAGDDMAFIKAIDSNDIRSEGMSYGMFIAVMMNDQATFNKLWKFTKTHIQNTSGPHQGFFAWQLSADAPYLPIATNPAPDGEEYFAMALFLANNRWGSDEGIFNYNEEANQILHDMIFTRSPTTRHMMHPDFKQVEFVTTLNVDSFTDPSYHLPAFYELWAVWANENNTYWHDVAKISRQYFTKASHPSTGLFSDYASHEGVPQVTSFNGNSHISAWDSFRVMGNLAMDYYWISESETLKELVERQVAFFENEVTTYGDFIALYNVDGSRVPGINYRSHGRTAMNAFGATVSNSPFAKEMITYLWQQDAPTGKYRYYDGMLHMLSLLHVSGEYKIYHPQ